MQTPNSRLERQWRHRSVDLPRFDPIRPLAMARVVAATVTSAAPGGTINFSFEGCGDASTLGTIKVLEPSSLILSGTITLVGSGDLSQDVSGGQFSFDAKALGVTIISDSGDLCQDKSISLPLGVGTFNYKSAGRPLAAGDVSLTFDATLSAAIPSQLAKLDIDIGATVDWKPYAAAACCCLHASFGACFPGTLRPSICWNPTQGEPCGAQTIMLKKTSVKSKKFAIIVQKIE